MRLLLPRKDFGLHLAAGLLALGILLTAPSRHQTVVCYGFRSHHSCGTAPDFHRIPLTVRFFNTLNYVNYYLSPAFSPLNPIKASYISRGFRFRYSEALIKSRSAFIVSSLCIQLQFMQDQTFVPFLDVIYSPSFSSSQG